ncbi:MAG TPA: ATP-binding protein [Streptosporangiaceae bacterium]|nr:ATP-binding protein [Streptosporangiaceae bacterium]
METTGLAKATSKPLSETRCYPGDPAQVGQVRRDVAKTIGACPMADDVVLLASELCTNAVTHSRSGLPGGSFTVRVEVHPADYVWVEVEDQGGTWRNGDHSDRVHGLDIVRAIVGDGNWGVDGGGLSRVVWARLDWPAL